MSRERADLRACMQLVNAYVAFLPLLPLISEAIEAEREAPGYGAEAIVFRRLIADVKAEPSA